MSFLSRGSRPANAFLVLTTAERQRLPEWQNFVSQRTNGKNVKVVMVGGSSLADFPLNFFSTAPQVAERVLKQRRPSDQVFVIVPDQGHDLLQAFTRKGIFPTYIETQKHQPAQALAARALG